MEDKGKLSLEILDLIIQHDPRTAPKAYSKILSPEEIKSNNELGRSVISEWELVVKEIYAGVKEAHNKGYTNGEKEGRRRQKVHDNYKYQKIEEAKKHFQKHMQGFPHSLIPITVRCLCSNWECIWYEEYDKPLDEKQFPIGWCKRYEPDPDAGYVLAYQLPPCVVWAVERKSPDKGE